MTPASLSAEHLQFLWEAREAIAPILCHQDGILDADSTPSGYVDAGLDRYDVPRLQALLRIRSEIRPGRNAVPKAVAVLLPVAARLDDAAGDGVYLLSADAGMHGLEACNLRPQHQVVDLTLFLARLAEDERSGEIGVVAVDRRSNVDQNEVAAAKRGVHVQVTMTNQPAWHGSFDALEAAGVQVRTYRPSASLYIHAKTIAVDGQRVFLGSENFSLGSLQRNRELGLVTVTKPIVQRIEQTFATDFAGATPWP